jgi:hypothetical protein
MRRVRWILGAVVLVLSSVGIVRCMTASSRSALVY